MSDRTRDSFRDKKGGDSDPESDEDYYSEDAYSPWKKGNMENFMSNMGKNNGILLIMAGAIVCVLIALLIFVPMLRSPGDTKQIADMETRIKKIEDKLATLDQEYQKVAQIAISGDKVDQLSSRVDKLSEATNQRLDQLSRDMEGKRRPVTTSKSETVPKPAAAPEHHAAPVKSEAAHKQIPHKPPEHKAEAAPKPKESHTAKSESKSANKKEAPKTASSSHPGETQQKKAPVTAKIHDVKPKETLYGIGRMYGISVDELRKLNHMNATDVPRIGQKLKVSP